MCSNEDKNTEDTKTLTEGEGAKTEEDFAWSASQFDRNWYNEEGIKCNKDRGGQTISGTRKSQLAFIGRYDKVHMESRALLMSLISDILNLEVSISPVGQNQ